MRAPIVETLDLCPEGGDAMIRVNGADGSHMGFALAMLKARWSAEPETIAVIQNAVPTDELLRSALELALSLSMTAVSGSSDDEDARARVEQDRQMAVIWLSSTADSYFLRGRVVASNLCADLASILDEDAPVPDLIVRVVDLTSALDLCAAIVTSTEVLRGVPVEDQFAAYEQILSLYVQEDAS